LSRAAGDGFARAWVEEQEDGMANEDQKADPKGEGNHEADRQYREATKRFVAGGRVEEAAEEAKRALAEDPDELEEAEEEGKARIAEEDPEVTGAPPAKPRG
jgi:hypothetical protein